jgi:hypothetical protein
METRRLPLRFETSFLALFAVIGYTLDLVAIVAGGNRRRVGGARCGRDLVGNRVGHGRSGARDLPCTSDGVGFLGCDPGALAGRVSVSAIVRDRFPVSKPCLRTSRQLLQRSLQGLWRSLQQLRDLFHGLRRCLQQLQGSIRRLQELLQQLQERFHGLQ